MTTGASNHRREIFLNRTFCTIDRDRIEIRPNRVLIVLPLLGLLAGAGSAAGVALGLDALPTGVLVLLLAVAVLTVPLSGMGVVYASVGSRIVVDRAKGSATFQQGVFGLGLGTRELVPFGKVRELRVREVAAGDPGRRPTEEFAQWEVILTKTSGRELLLGTLTVHRSQAAGALAEAVALAVAVAEMAGGVPVHHPPLARERRRRRAARP